MTTSRSTRRPGESPWRDINRVMHELYAEQLARAVGGGFIDETTARAILTDAIARPDRTAGTSVPRSAPTRPRATRSPP